MKPNDKELLLKQLAEQLDKAFGLNGVWGDDAVASRRASCESANSILAMLEEYGMDPEEALEKAEAMICWN